MKNEIRFKQIVTTSVDDEVRLYGLTEEGKVYYFNWDSNNIDWIPMGMRVEEES